MSIANGNGNGNGAGRASPRLPGNIYMYAYAQGEKAVAPKRHRRNAFALGGPTRNLVVDIKSNHNTYWGYDSETNVHRSRVHKPRVSRIIPD